MNTIINDTETECLIFPNIICDYVERPNYSSKIMEVNNAFKYMQKYNQFTQIDGDNNYLIDIQLYCNTFNKTSIASSCPIFHSKNANNSLSNIITEEYYTLKDYINNPTLLKSFIDKHPKNFANIFFLQFKQLFLGLQNIIKNNKCHGKITPENITFNPNTEKLKFINYGMFENTEVLKTNLRLNFFFGLKKYRPMACFFANYHTFRNFSYLQKRNRDIFYHHVRNKLNDTPSIPRIGNQVPALSTLINQFDRINNANLVDYKAFIIRNGKTSIKILHDIKTIYVGNDLSKNDEKYKIFLQNIICGIDIYGLSLTIAEFIKTVHDNYPFNNEMYKKLINFLNKITDESITERMSYDIDHLIENLISKITANVKIHANENIPQIKNTTQYELKSKDIQLFNGSANKNYINYNHRVMRVFTKNNIFKHLNLSSKNYTKIRKIMNNAKYILIDKDAYYKIKYKLFCADNTEINPFTRKCVKKCNYDHYRYFHDDIFTCKKYSKKNKHSRSSNNDSKSKKYRKKCSQGYERNPFTKRCTRKCSKGYIRNLKFNCISEKDVL
jgi:hypothetical protein